MRNFEPYPDESFDFHKKVLNKKRNSKNDPKYKERVEAYNILVKTFFKCFDEHFANNTIESLGSFGSVDPQKSDLQKLYSYKISVIQELKIKITTTETNRIINKCQNCTINAVNSFDHYLPQVEFAELSVHPRNLFPSCTECNNHKNCIWKESGKRVFLNLYLDELPKEQYLFANLDITANNIIAEFVLRRPEKVDPNLFSLINNHYERLHLPRRFSENIDDVVTKLINGLKTNISKVGVDEARETATEVSNRNMKAFGFNFWEAILEIELVNNDEFIKHHVL